MITLSNTVTLPISQIKNNFVPNYCRTCHSFQGSAIEEAMTIFDHKFAYASHKWLYTAVTKATDIKQVYFYDYDENAKTEGHATQIMTR